MQLIRRVGVIGDAHAEDEALAFALEQLTTLGVDTLLQVGDIADGPGDLTRTIALLQQYGVLAVRGNHDRWQLANQMRELQYAKQLHEVDASVVEYLSQLPVTRELESARGRVLMCHGLGENDMAKVKPYDEGYALSSNFELQQLILAGRFRLVINGHSHKAMLRTFGGLSIVNAGTLLRDDERCFTLLDFERGDLVRYSTDAGTLPMDLGSWRQARQVLPDSIVE